MSIATLKKKTGYLYNSQSVGYKNFSLNGTHRSQGWVGQTMLSRSLPRTLARGNVNCGHGGLYGSYNDNIHPITSGLVNWNDNQVIKSSVGNTMGMLEKRNNCLNNFDCRKIKPSVKKLNNYQSKIAKCALASHEASKTKNVNTTGCCSIANAPYMKKDYINMFTHKIVGGVTKDLHVLSESRYIDIKTSKCLGDSTNIYYIGYRRCPLPGN